MLCDIGSTIYSARPVQMNTLMDFHHSRLREVWNIKVKAAVDGRYPLTGIPVGPCGP